MPVHQIAVAPAQEGKSSPRTKDQSERAKAPGRSGGRSSGVAKAKGATAGAGSASKTSATPSVPQDSSGPQARPEESGVANSQPGGGKSPRPVTMTTASQSTQTKKKAVKRRHRRKKDVCGALGCVEAPGQQASPDPGSGEEGEEEEGGRREEPAPRPRGPPSDSTSEDEGVRREARSWSKEKARRGRRRSGDRPAGTGVRQRGEPGGDRGAPLELQSMGSGDEEGAGGEDEGGRQKRCRGGGGSLKNDGGSPSRGSSAGEEGQVLHRGSYAEMGSGGGDSGVPTATKRCGVNGDTQAQTVCSEDSDAEVCRICHCEGEEDAPLITPCWCLGSLQFVHQACLNQWIKSSDTRCCELCKYDFIMETQLKPLSKWERLHMTKGEWRKLLCSVMFHLLALACVSWSVYVLIKRTMEDFRLGKEDELWRLALMKYYTLEGVVEWPFWTKLTVVGMGVISGLIFMYIQCAVYLQLWRRLKAFNRIITVQNCPEKGPHPPQDQHPLVPLPGDTVEVPVLPEQVPGEQTDSDQSVEAAVAPV